MFAKYFENRREKRIAREFVNSPIGQTLTKHSENFITRSVLRHVTEDYKQHLINEFIAEVITVSANSNPFLASRQKLCDYAIYYANLQVLCLKPEEKTDLFYGQSRFISGELHKHLRDLAKYNKDLEERLWEFPGKTDEQLITFLNLRCAGILYFLNGWELLRKEFEQVTTVPEKDWFRPFLISMMIFSENTYRQNIGLPLLSTDPLFALRHSSFMNIVRSGGKNPLYEWESHFKLVHNVDSR